MNLNILEKFKNVTRYDIEQFLEDYYYFVQNYYPLIVDYYGGEDIDNDSFTNFDYLKDEMKKIEALIDYHSSTFETTDFWELNDKISDIQISLSTVDNLGKWLRSSKVDRYSSNLKVEYVQGQNQSLENIAESFGFSEVDDWADLAIKNQIREEDYTNEGGKMLSAFFPITSTFDLDNIVDNLSAENVYGKDIYSTFEISSDGDLRVLSGVDSLSQTFNTIMNTTQGSIPEFPEDGIPSYLVGSNQNTLQYPVLFRSLLNMFQKDKRFVSFEILDIDKSEDNIFIKTQTKTIMGEDFINSISI